MRKVQPACVRSEHLLQMGAERWVNLVCVRFNSFEI